MLFLHTFAKSFARILTLILPEFLVAKNFGGQSAPLPPASYAYAYRCNLIFVKMGLGGGGHGPRTPLATPVGVSIIELLETTYILKFAWWYS